MSRLPGIYFSLFVLLGASGVLAQSSAAPEQTEDPKMMHFKTFMTELRSVFRDARQMNLLGQLEGYRSLQREFGGKDAGIDKILASYLAWKLSAVGRYREAHLVFDQAVPVAQPTPEEVQVQRASLKGFEPRDAVAALTRATEKRQVVFINEAHHVPQHRALTLRMLPILRQQGFTHFAAETLIDSDESLRQRGYPSPATGTYTDEPLYADLVRTALKLGFHLVGYESEDEGRELGQAKNLVARIFEQTPEARLVVHLGYAHNHEGADSFRGVGAMAYHFKTLTGIDPLTVDQTKLSEHGDRASEHPLYAEVCGSLASAVDPIVYQSPTGDFWSLPADGRDITICQPRSKIDQGRPTWLTLGGLRRPIALSEDICGAKATCLVEVRPDGEGEDAIPVDSVEIRANETPPALMLPVGTFNIEVVDAGGTKLRSLTKTVGQAS